MSEYLNAEYWRGVIALDKVVDYNITVVLEALAQGDAATLQAAMAYTDDRLSGRLAPLGVIDAGTF